MSTTTMTENGTPGTELPEVDPILLPGADPVTTPAGEDSRPKRKRPTTRAGRRAEAERKAATAGGTTPQPAPTGRTVTRTPTGNAKVVAEGVKGLHELVGGIVLPMASLPATGAALAATGEQAGQVWAELSKRYPAIVKLFTGANDGMLFLQLLLVYYPVILAGMTEARTPKDERQAAAGEAMAGLAGLLGGLVNEPPPPAGG